MELEWTAGLALISLLPLFLSAGGSPPPGEGDPAPDFEASDEEGTLWRSADHVGRKVLVVYFYPADMTPGCTQQACGFRDHMSELKAQGVEVVGVSGDSPANHRLFKKAHQLNFSLLSDQDGAVATRFGVPMGKGGSFESEVEGRRETLTRGVTASRWTFVIDRRGRIAYRDSKVEAAGDGARILEVIRGLDSDQKP